MEELNKKILNVTQDLDLYVDIYNNVLATIEKLSDLLKGVCLDDLDLIKDSICNVYITLVVGNELDSKVDLNKIYTIMREFRKVSKKPCESKLIIIEQIAKLINFIVGVQNYKKLVASGIIDVLLTVCDSYNIEILDCVKIE
ncbi:hypothetical protein [Finegoldia magna]|uniref:Uncharacterized protein n=1 Tax=Finegoldia magna (strain ATCC 29328 / DSM 20472 / WAL 2508) TaxID=334413 RepID=B0S4E8_FINM2|nr:hypothetical protein [Finegoldia magna]UEA71179.1 hypothetical protein LK415_08685 [Finegoldia magna]BAG09139.1 hypothetical protein FMG_P0090 [Finegoldia magna ATCC 29328]